LTSLIVATRPTAAVQVKAAYILPANHTKSVIMAEYDPTDPPTYDAADESYDPDYDNAEEQGDAADEESRDDESDYDPSSFDVGDRDEQTGVATPQTAQPQFKVEASTQAPRTKTKAGFIVDESDDEKEDDDGVQSTQLNETASAQSDIGVRAVAEAQDMSLHSAPQETVASSKSINGSTAVPVSTSASPVPASSLQSSVPHQGKPTTPVPPITSIPQPTAAAPTMPAAGGIPAQAPTSLPARLPHDKVGQLEDRIKDDPKGDANAWISLIEHYLEKGQHDFARNVYQRFFKVFPYAVRSSFLVSSIPSIRSIGSPFSPITCRSHA
jgi:cleavage stimulation factor subunit 3